MSVADDLRALSAPRVVVEAGEEIDKASTARLRPSTELVEYVKSWVCRNRGNNRYGL